MKIAWRTKGSALSVGSRTSDGSPVRIDGALCAGGGVEKTGLMGSNSENGWTVSVAERIVNAMPAVEVKMAVASHNRILGPLMQWMMDRFMLERGERKGCGMVLGNLL